MCTVVMVHSHIKHGQSFPMMETLRSLTNAVIRISEAEKKQVQSDDSPEGEELQQFASHRSDRVHQGPVQESCKATLAKPH